MIWNRRQRLARLMLGAALMTCALVTARPQSAVAGWPLATAGRVVLGFGVAYTSADATASSTHRGVDIAAEGGAQVVAPLSGKVTFSGRVPAVGGGTVRAVTLSTTNGVLTLLPLSVVSVAKGDSLAEGAAVGLLAESGDGSSAGPHLHVGIRHGDLYVDPMTLLTLPPAPSSEPPGSESAAATADQPHAAGSAAAGHALSPGVTIGGSHAPQTLARPSGVRADERLRAASAPLSALRAAVPGARLAPGVSVAGLAPAPRASVAAAALQRAVAPLLAGAPPEAAADAQLAAKVVGSLCSRAKAASAQAERLGGLLGLSILGAVGLLWPLWRRDSRKGSGEDTVSLFTEDVAAVVGRW